MKSTDPRIQVDVATWMRDPPVFSDARAFAWVVSTLTVTLAGAVFGLAFFPPGHYPRIVLALPGLAAGAVVYFCGPLFKLANWLVALSVACLVLAAGLALLSQTFGH